LILFRVGGRGRRRSLAAHRLARAMLKRARLTDDVGWLGEQHLAALLPDTSSAGAEAFAEGVTAMISRHGPRPAAMVYAYPRDAAAMAASAEARQKPNATATHISGKPVRHGLDNIRSQIVVRFNENSLRHANGRTPVKPNGHGGACDICGGERILPTAATALANAGDHDAAQASAEANHVAAQSGAGVRHSATAASAKSPAAAKLPVAGLEELLAYPTPIWKRVLDIIGALILLTLLSPVLAAAALAIKLTSPGPVMFFQRRSGLGGKPFTIFKLRTMVVGAEKRQQELRALNEQDGPAFKLTADPRVTRVGAFLRKTSIDELPQLLNVLKGDMSLVGPRPLPLKEQEGCEQWQRHRLNVAPGVTCIWQVKGRSQVSFADWVRMDVEYMRRRTILHDLTILFSTIPSVLLRRGAR